MESGRYIILTVHCGYYWLEGIKMRGVNPDDPHLKRDNDVVMRLFK